MLHEKMVCYLLMSVDYVELHLDEPIPHQYWQYIPYLSYREFEACNFLLILVSKKEIRENEELLARYI